MPLMSNYPQISLDYQLTQDLNAVTDKINLCMRQLYLLDVAVYHRDAIHLSINDVAGPLSILYNMLDEAAQQLTSINEPINTIRAAVHEECLRDKADKNRGGQEHDG